MATPSNHSLWSPDVYSKAWNFATLAHHGQRYGGPHHETYFDYLNHIGSVAMEVTHAIVQSPPCDADLAVQCALLHDVLEDTEATHDQLVEQFGPAVAAGVLALSKDTTLPKEEQLADSLRRIRLQPREVWMVKLADRITNLYHPPFYWGNDKILAYQQEARFIWEQLHEANDALSRRLLEMISRYPQFLRKG
jgi:(p)ppGpp synthase/HD superfamily hydrolase